MIKYPETFNRMKPVGYDGEFSWDFLLPSFSGTKISPMDLDFVVERGGKFLIIETKNSNTPIPVGQKITLESFIKLGKGLVTVFIVFGKNESSINKIEEWLWDTNTNKVVKYVVECDSQYLLSMVSGWFSIANKGKS